MKLSDSLLNACCGLSRGGGFSVPSSNPPKSLPNPLLCKTLYPNPKTSQIFIAK